ncbi:hypothetical protein [Sulfobacillus thermosulfidooxidans]|uniref:hypothetical protein n=1 Tax=Sulfobacillus thermosulfidooxidans TaxID=28034 RepID=UPI0012FE51CE|nr:hypothetical protein [Sulfobacillus thermosulfidooxidans]
MHPFDDTPDSRSTQPWTDHSQHRPEARDASDDLRSSPTGPPADPLSVSDADAPDTEQSDVVVSDDEVPALDTEGATDDLWAADSAPQIWTFAISFTRIRIGTSYQPYGLGLGDRGQGVTSPLSPSAKVASFSTL